MVFQRAYTARQLNRGEGMTFHPMSGELLQSLSFSTRGKKFFRRFPGTVFLFWEDDDELQFLPSIGGYGRKKYQSGDRYPRQWVFDPFTGLLLSNNKVPL